MSNAGRQQELSRSASQLVVTSPLWGTLGNVWRHFWLSQLRNVTGIQWAEARDAAKYPTMHRTAAQSQELSSQSVNSTQVEKPSKQ